MFCWDEALFEEKYQVSEMETRELKKDYSVVWGQLESEAWYKIIDHFRDGNLYQTFSYGSATSRTNRIFHLIVRKSNKLVAAAQIKIVQLPLLKYGIAYILWGPMWQIKGERNDADVFRMTVRALRNELSLRRGLVLRIFPLAFRAENETLESILREEGYQLFEDGKSHRSLIIDLEASLKEIRENLEQKWRNCLNRAEKNGLELISGQDGNLFEEIRQIYKEMINRKELYELSNLNHYLKVQQGLPPDLKMKVILCRMNGENCAGAIFSAIGSTGVYHVGATSNAGMKTNGSYLIQWAFLKWLKENGFSHYDLNGINPNANPGTYRFKRGLAGKRGRDVEFLGKYQVVDNRVSSFVVKNGERLLMAYQKIERIKRSFRNAARKQVMEN